MIISKKGGFRHYLTVFLLIMAVFLAGKGIINLVMTQTISIGEILAMLGLLLALAVYMDNRLKKKKAQKKRK